ncbi:MAG: hypothetical protein ACE5IP_01125 [Terriglobia bacterium]
MKERTLLVALLLGGLLTVAAALDAQQTGKAQLLTGEDLNKLLPTSVFLDGENAPVQRRNAVGARMGDGKILVVTLIDTSGFSSQYQEKYVGMLMAQGNLVIGRSGIKPGAYGLGRRKTSVGSKLVHMFVLYDLGGNPVVELPAHRDQELRPVKPIQLRVGAAPAARLYLGPYFVRLSTP